MASYYIVWNERKTEGALFLRDDQDEALGDALHAGGGMDISAHGVSTLADSFRDIYGESQQSWLQKLDIDTDKVSSIEKD